MMCERPFFKMPSPAELKRGATPIPVPCPCGWCLSCRINKSREMKHRILMESLATEKSCFLTLTYDDKHLPEGDNLDKVHLQKYWKRLRKKVWPDTFRYFASGEYGDISGRPHYHAAVFGLGMERSEEMGAAWGMGHHLVGDITADSASYIAGYCIKKLTRSDDPRLNGKRPEFTSASNRHGGIGLPGVKRLAQKLKETRGFQKRPLTEIAYGRQKMPLGRYLTDKFAKEMEVEKELKFLKDEHFNEMVCDALREGGLYPDNIVNQKAQKRRQQRKKHNIYKKRRYL